MGWLDSVVQLALALESQSEHWICYLQCESSSTFRHPHAVDHSLGRAEGNRIQVASASPAGSLKDVWVRCFFAPNPVVECQEFVAEKFFENPKVKESCAAIFLIPYFSLDEYRQTQSSPFLKFQYPQFIELRGGLDDEQPEISGQGSIFETWCELSGVQFTPTQTSLCGAIEPKAHAEQNNLVNKKRSSSQWRVSESPDSLRAMFNALKDLMRRGECYLANASTRMLGPRTSEVRFTLSDFVSQWIESPSRFGVYVHDKGKTPSVVCFSPERFVLRQGVEVQTEPIKGTAPLDSSLPDCGSYRLWNNSKEMFEQKMVCDLLRNDLNKVCRPGSVQVRSPYEVKPAGSLLQMQSTILGELENPTLSHSEILQKLLPAGSISGTPKFAVGQFLKSLEQTPRGYYTGVFAIAEDARNFDSTILIRGFFSDTQSWYAGLGSGVTVLSDVEHEAQEFNLKWSSFLKRWTTSQSSAVAGAAARALELDERSFSAKSPVIDSHVQENQSFILVESKAEQGPKNVSHSQAFLFELKTTADLLRLKDTLKGSYLFVDHQDSFSENLIAALRSRGVNVARLTSCPSRELKSRAETEDFTKQLVHFLQCGIFSALILSPGPGRPDDYPFSKHLLTLWSPKWPVLGVCLGHQMLLSQEGCELQLAAENPVHGREQQLTQVEASRFLGSFDARGSCTFYNSWCVSCDEFQSRAGAWTLCFAAGNSVALCEHKSRPWVGVQFHPESFASEPGRRFLDAFVAMCSTVALACRS